MWPTLTDPTRALVRSQQGPLASATLTACPQAVQATTIPGVVVQALLSPTPDVLALADVAAFLTCMATIKRRVRGLGCWVVEVSLWGGRLLKCAGSRRTCRFGQVHP